MGHGPLHLIIEDRESDLTEAFSQRNHNLAEFNAWTSVTPSPSFKSANYKRVSSDQYQVLYVYISRPKPIPIS
jgi:hypothetical protein